eukprot:CAMPEP_0116110622 /NCGR_PEP_ID=MMETSP0327-20121206/18009_1 /TAXON_ID=44447 /ORGANISM="Pseudo-nitzschia delicatissima, Strain B596" /LENGTH=1657 /DNA_ID=CAMNT_0003603797 /DNA_START=292 /DNA_END=5265 /DNA_ORIENTATION=+
MFIGETTRYFPSAYSSWTTLGPLAFVISCSLLVEGSADIKRHRSDDETNNAECIILRRSDDINRDKGKREGSVIGGKSVIVNLSKQNLRLSAEKGLPLTNEPPDLVMVAFQKIKRMNIRQGHIVLIRNREEIPADVVILATSGENGCAYIETSSIDGETNLKLRNTPTLPSAVTRSSSAENLKQMDEDEDDGKRAVQSLERASKNITRFSALGYPDGVPAIDLAESSTGHGPTRPKSIVSPRQRHERSDKSLDINNRNQKDDIPVIATLVSETPNSHINTFSGKLVLPPLEKGGNCVEIPLDAENILLRGAVLRNTEWVIGLSCFTGKDTKLVRNSSQTPSKFSRIDVLINKCVVLIILFMLLCIAYLSIRGVWVSRNRFDELWYAGLNHNATMKWPYLPDDLPPPEWTNTTDNLLQKYLTFVTLLSNFVPLSMYITLEAVNFFCLWLVYVDPEMYDDKSDTRAVSRSTNVTDLGQVQHIFSDKTGTLTQNVMRFKRCSVDGMIFGAPVAKTRPKDSPVDKSTLPAFHPTRQLVVGNIDYSADRDRVKASAGMTFNAEMFIRVMSLCHTVVVEKDLDNKKEIDESKSVSSSGSNWMFSGKGKKKKQTQKFGRVRSDMSGSSSRILETVSEEPGDQDLLDLSDKGTSRSSIGSIMVRGGDGEGGVSSSAPTGKSRDGAPVGFAYQAESPDENALVSEASKIFGFQVFDRNSTGIILRCDHPTIFSDDNLVRDLRNGKISPKSLVSNRATGKVQVERSEEERLKYTKNKRTETWEILAVNKFDSHRKRMSILLRSPPELGSVVVLFCKGADSAMLDPDVCSGSQNVFSGDAVHDANKSSQFETTVNENEDSEWDTAQMLGIQSHLGEFASEGLRTLVLGVRFLTDSEAEKWLTSYQKAASSLKNRDKKLRKAAFAIERNLHIVGATAVEDKLQVGVPKTIATLSKAGIKLWVLTGDKRETAIEIGYSTKVLTPSMHLTEVADQGVDFVRAQCAIEFMRLVKAGKLPLYQKAAIDEVDKAWSWENIIFAIKKGWRSFLRMRRSYSLALNIRLRKMFGLSPELQEKERENLKVEQQNEKERLEDNVRRRNVRNLAEQVILEFKRKCSQSQEIEPLSPASSFDDVPSVFNRAESARSALKTRSSKDGLTSHSLRNIRLSQLTAQEVTESEGQADDDDILSLKSICLATSNSKSIFDPRKRTVLERLFSVDRDVRRGRLLKHKKKDEEGIGSSMPQSGEASRALVIEGNALKHLLGNGEWEELLFNVANQCDSVIACRVSPQQKALLVKLVRHHVVPEPVTLAIGDGANDVGMIQEAHVGIGISGKEGRQAVNASDFAIAQFRFLESLLLIHGRWDFMRQATVVLFSFYKNAVMAGCLIVYNASSLYSGQSLFDQWTVSAFNFLVFWPIYFLGIFDRCLEKDYIRKNPEVYQATRQNEVLTLRVLFRWIFMTVSHVVILYFGSFYYLSGGNGNTSAFLGLMKFYTRVGDGEGTDLNSIGLVTFNSLIIMLAFKVLYESRTIIVGKWPPWWNARKEGFVSRVPYSWYGITLGSLYFHFLFFLPIYNYITKTTDKKDESGFFDFLGTYPHVMATSSVNWISMTFIPIAGMAYDVCWKVFSNMFYPTQTQIHTEIEVQELADKRADERTTRRSDKKMNLFYWRSDV